MAGIRDKVARWTREGTPFELIEQRITRPPAQYLVSAKAVPTSPESGLCNDGTPISGSRRSFPFRRTCRRANNASSL